MLCDIPKPLQIPNYFRGWGHIMSHIFFIVFADFSLRLLPKDHTTISWPFSWLSRTREIQCRLLILLLSLHQQIAPKNSGELSFLHFVTHLIFYSLRTRTLLYYGVRRKKKCVVTPYYRIPKVFGKVVI